MAIHAACQRETNLESDLKISQSTCILYTPCMLWAHTCKSLSWRHPWKINLKKNSHSQATVQLLRYWHLMDQYDPLQTLSSKDDLHCWFLVKPQFKCHRFRADITSMKKKPYANATHKAGNSDQDLHHLIIVYQTPLVARKSWCHPLIRMKRVSDGIDTTESCWTLSFQYCR